MAFIIFAQSLGPAIVLVLCNVVFNSSLKSQLRKEAPSINASEIIQAGATGFRAIVRPNELVDVLVAYSRSINHVFYLVTAVASVCLIVLWGMGWHDLRKKGDERQKDLKHTREQNEV